VALVLNEQIRRAECLGKKLADAFGSLFAHGRTSLNGFTITLE
jgi:hypothetical protein